MRINSTKLLDITIYDLSGRSVYSANAQNNVFIGCNTFNFTNGLYMIRLMNMEGEENILTFIFNNNSFIFNENEGLYDYKQDNSMILEYLLSI
ncbi:MAG: T9SS type A sorting domain-containing protein [Ignavibacteria bacterium]|nr:T9SS type A sorting domain-containing protein [Ignavibacteria bacterium]